MTGGHGNFNWHYAEWMWLNTVHVVWYTWVLLMFMLVLGDGTIHMMAVFNGSIHKLCIIFLYNIKKCSKSLLQSHRNPYKHLSPSLINEKVLTKFHIQISYYTVLLNLGWHLHGDFTRQSGTSKKQMLNTIT